MVMNSTPGVYATETGGGAGDESAHAAPSGVLPDWEWWDHVIGHGVGVPGWGRKRQREFDTGVESGAGVRG